MFTLNDILDKIERPTRSGVEGALLMVMLLSSVLTPSYADSAYCGILPWKCEVQAAEPEKEKLVTPLVFGNGPGGEDECLCQERWLWKGIWTIQSWPMREAHDTCTAFDGFKLAEATPDWQEEIPSHPGFGQFRLHCEKGKPA